MATLARRQLMIAPETAEYLRRPLATLYAWRSRGQGPHAIKVGRSLLYDAADVERWLAELDRPGAA